MTAFFARWPSGRWCKWRSLSQAEYKRFERELQYRRPMEVYMDIYRAVVLDGPEDRDITAGIVECVARSMMDNNPFNGKYDDVKRAVDMKRFELKTDYMLAAKAVIASLFNVTTDEIDRWDAEKFFEHVAMAEFVSGRKLEPGNPNKKKRGQKQGPQKKPLTDRQQIALENVRRERNMPMPAEETVYDPEVEENAPKLKRRPMTNAQQIVADRVRRERMR